MAFFVTSVWLSVISMLKFPPFLFSLQDCWPFTPFNTTKSMSWTSSKADLILVVLLARGLLFLAIA